MTERAIDRLLKIMRENLRGFTRHDIDSDSYNRGYAYCLEEYIERGEQMAQEEKSHKAEAPASLVERLRQSIEGHKKIFEAQQEELDSRVAAVKNIEDIVSEYRPTPQADILGELKSVLYAPCVFSESWKKVEKAKEIISKFEGGVK